MLSWLGPRLLARCSWSLLVLAFFAGGLRVAWNTAVDGPEQSIGLSSAAESDSDDNRADDRVRDTVAGIVRGPVEDRHGRRRVVVCVPSPDHALERSRRSRTSREPCIAASLTLDLDITASLLPGDGVVMTGTLRTPRGYRVPGAADMAEIARRRGHDLRLTGAELVSVEPAAERSWWRYPVIAQRRASQAIAVRGGDGHGNALVRAMVTGDRVSLDSDLEERFRRAGISHVLAVSGLHLAVVALLTFVVIRRLWATIPPLALRVEPALAAALIAAPVALGFTLMTGARVSTLRALLVVTVALLAAATTRRVRIIDALGLAAIALLVHDPDTLFDPSFQLSFAATATLALAQRSGARPGQWPGRAWHRARDLLRASIWATLATAPITAMAFGEVALAGIATNLIAVPLTELVVVPLGVMGCALSTLWSDGGGWLIDLAVLGASWLDGLARFIAERVPVTAVFPPGGRELAACAMIWASALAAVRGVLSRRAAGVAIAAGIVALFSLHAATAWWSPARRDHVRVTFLDVGQGDAAVVELPDGATWLIDGGGLPFVSNRVPPERRQRVAALPGERSVVRFLAHQRIDHIDRLIISHPHPDHYQGIRAVARHVSIAEIWIADPGPLAAPESTATPDDGSSFGALLAELQADGAQVMTPRLDQPYIDHGVALTALAPRYLGASATADPVSSVNDNSLVVRLDFAGRSVLFTGDIEHESEELLTRRHDDLRVDIVKVPHHGSRTSSTEALVAATRPTWAVISCGVANRFGFPAAEVEERWRRGGARVLRTDQLGAITAVITRDGELGLWSHDRSSHGPGADHSR